MITQYINTHINYILKENEGNIIDEVLEIKVYICSISISSAIFNIALLLYPVLVPRLALAVRIFAKCEFNLKNAKEKSMPFAPFAEELLEKSFAYIVHLRS